MEGSGKILRKSIHSFLQNYLYFTSTAAVLVLPFSASILLSQAPIPASSSLFPHVYSRLKTLFESAGFPSSSQLFSTLNLKISQTITSSILTFPFILTLLLAAKAFVIHDLNHNKSTFPPSFVSIFSIYKPLLHTYIWTSLLIISANATAFSLLSLTFSCFEGLGFSSPNCVLLLSAAGVVLFSVILANALVIGNMAMVLSGMEGHGGYMAILKACILIRGRTSIGLFLALPLNVILAAIEALFQFRVVRAYHIAQRPGYSMVSEGLLIAYLYSIFIVLDTIVSCMFYNSCKRESLINQDDKHSLRIEFSEVENYGHMGTKNFEELP